jgi:hypothetical protein
MAALNINPNSSDPPPPSDSEFDSSSDEGDNLEFDMDQDEPPLLVFDSSLDLPDAINMIGSALNAIRREQFLQRKLLTAAPPHKHQAFNKDLERAFTAPAVWEKYLKEVDCADLNTYLNVVHQHLLDIETVPVTTDLQL